MHSVETRLKPRSERLTEFGPQQARRWFRLPLNGFNQCDQLTNVLLDATQRVRIELHALLQKRLVAAEAAPADPFEEIDFGNYFQEYLDPGFRSQREFEEIEKPGFEQFLSRPTSLQIK